MTKVDSAGINEEQSFSKLSVYSKLPPGLGCTAPSYLPPAPARLVPVCGARLLARARGSIRHEEHFVQQPAAAS